MAVIIVNLKYSYVSTIWLLNRCKCNYFRSRDHMYDN